MNSISEGMNDIKSMTVEELNEWALSWGSYAAAFDELARRLEEAEQALDRWRKGYNTITRSHYMNRLERNPS